MIKKNLLQNNILFSMLDRFVFFSWVFLTMSRSVSSAENNGTHETLDNTELLRRNGTFNVVFPSRKQQKKKKRNKILIIPNNGVWTALNSRIVALAHARGEPIAGLRLPPIPNAML